MPISLDQPLLSLDQLLKENYYSLTSRECKLRVLDFLSERESIKDLPVLFVKRLTKVAHHLLVADPNALEELVEKLYHFNLEGADSVKFNKLDDGIDGSFSLLESHFCEHAGRAAKLRFKRTGDLAWAERWYQAEKSGAELSVDANPKHAAYAFGFAAEAARVLFKKTHQFHWAERWYQAEKSGAELSVDANPKHAAYAFGFAAEAAKILYERTCDLSWVEKWYNADLFAAELSIKINPSYAVRCFKFASSAANIFFKKSIKIDQLKAKEWTERCHYAASSCLKLSQTTDLHKEDPQFTGYCYLDLASASREMFKLTQDCCWEEERYYALSKAVDCFERANITKLVADHRNQQGHSARIMAEKCEQQHLDELASYWRKVAHHDFKDSALQSSEYYQRAHRFRRAGEAALYLFREKDVSMALEALDCFYRYVNSSVLNLPPPEFKEEAEKMLETIQQQINYLKTHPLVLESETFQRRKNNLMHKI